MLVKMKVGIASADWSYAPDEIVDIDADLAKAWISSDIAERVPGSEAKPVPPKKGGK